MALNFGKLSLWVALWLCVPISLFGMCSTGMTASPTEGPKLVWKKTFSGEQGRVFLDLALLPDDSIVVTGFTMTTDPETTKALVMRLNGDGKLIWEKTFGDKDWSRSNAVTALTGGEFVLTVSERAANSEISAIRVLRLDKMGNIIWDNILEGSLSAGAYDVTVLPQERIGIAGYVEAEEREDLDAFVIGLNENGELLWNWSLGDENTETARGIAAFPDGSLALAGIVQVPNPKGWLDFTYYWIDRRNPDGTELWHKVDTTFGRDKAYDIAVLSDDSVVITGRKDNRREPTNADIAIQRLATDGTVLWDRGYGGPDFDAGYAITPYQIAILP